MTHDLASVWPRCSGCCGGFWVFTACLLLHYPSRAATQSLVPGCLGLQSTSLVNPPGLNLVVDSKGYLYDSVPEYNNVTYVCELQRAQYSKLLVIRDLVHGTALTWGGDPPDCKVDANGVISTPDFCQW